MKTDTHMHENIRHDDYYERWIDVQLELVFIIFPTSYRRYESTSVVDGIWGSSSDLSGRR